MCVGELGCILLLPPLPVTLQRPRVAKHHRGAPQPPSGRGCLLTSTRLPPAGFSTLLPFAVGVGGMPVAVRTIGCACARVTVQGCMRENRVVKCRPGIAGWAGRWGSPSLMRRLPARRTQAGTWGRGMRGSCLARARGCVVALPFCSPPCVGTDTNRKQRLGAGARQTEALACASCLPQRAQQQAPARRQGSRALTPTSLPAARRRPPRPPRRRRPVPPPASLRRSPQGRGGFGPSGWRRAPARRRHR
jgi:hypothetical protein